MHTTAVGQVCFDNMLRLIDRAGHNTKACPLCGSGVLATLLPWDFPFTEAVRRAQDDCRAAYQRKHALPGPTPAWRCLDYGGPCRPPWPRWRATAPSLPAGQLRRPRQPCHATHGGGGRRPGDPPLCQPRGRRRPARPTLGVLDLAVQVRHALGEAPPAPLPLAGAAPQVHPLLERWLRGSGNSLRDKLLDAGS
jgi:hypothetical protein